MVTDVLKVVQQFFPDVNKVIDAKKEKFITVTQDDCRKAVKLRTRADHTGCVMGIAIKRQEGIDGALVARSRVYLVTGQIAERYFSTPAITRELTAFDRGSDFDPGVYKLASVPESSTAPQRAKRRRRDGHKHAHKSHTHNFKHITRNIRYSIG